MYDYQTNKCTTYITDNILHIVSSLLHVSMHLRHLQTVLSFYCAKVIKIIMVTNSIKSALYNIYMIIIFDDKIVYNML